MSWCSSLFLVYRKFKTFLVGFRRFRKIHSHFSLHHLCLLSFEATLKIIHHENLENFRKSGGFNLTLSAYKKVLKYMARLKIRNEIWLLYYQHKRIPSYLSKNISLSLMLNIKNLWRCKFHISFFAYFLKVFCGCNHTY